MIPFLCFPVTIELSQDWVSKAFEREIEKQEAPVFNFEADKGDVLIWHGRLVHRGSAPMVPGKQRKGIIAHYSALSKRKDMPEREQYKNGSWYFVHRNPLV